MERRQKKRKWEINLPQWGLLSRLKIDFLSILGEFVKNKREGYGKFVDFNEIKYEGHWKDDKRHDQEGKIL